MRGMGDFGDFLFMFGGLAALVWVAPAMLLVSFLVIYVTGEVTGRRAGRRDPLLGAKVFATLLATVGLQTTLAGTATVLGEFFEEGDYGQALLDAGGLILGGGIVAAYASMAYYTRLRLHGTDRVLKQAVGLNAIVTGLVFAFSLTLALHIWLNGRDGLGYPLAFTMVYVAGNIACAVPLLTPPPADFDADED